MKPIFHRKVQKFIQSVTDTALRDILKRHIDIVIDSPSSGKPLEHPFKKYQIRVVRCVYKGYQYRIAYTVSKIDDKIIFLLVDKRKDFYQKLRRMM